MRGVCVLVIEVTRSVEVAVGSLGRMQFVLGTYANMGSAMKGLEAWARRHLSDQKGLHWHVDYLLATRAPGPPWSTA